MKPKYLYISEGGAIIFTSSDAPTPLDLKCVSLGTLYIVRLSDMTEVMEDGNWIGIDKGILCNTPDNSEKYHWLVE